MGDPRQLDFANDAFDLIWCEGAIYKVGVEAAPRDWRRFLRRNGHVACTEACWGKPEPAAECAAHWKREYPAVHHAAALLGVMRQPSSPVRICRYSS